VSAAVNIDWAAELPAFLPDLGLLPELDLPSWEEVNATRPQRVGQTTAEPARRLRRVDSEAPVRPFCDPELPDRGSARVMRGK
jgi:hypothetical protein